MKIGDPRLPNLNPESQFSLMDWTRSLVRRLYELFRSVDSAFDSMYQHRFVVPTSVTVTVGTTTSTVADVQDLGANSYSVTEVAAAPGIDIEFTFQGVRRIRAIACRAVYFGSATHAVRVRLYNYTTAAYVGLDAFNLSQGFELHFAPIPDDSAYISGGEAKIEFYHTETGNVSHNFQIDYLALVE